MPEAHASMHSKRPPDGGMKRGRRKATLADTNECQVLGWTWATEVPRIWHVSQMLSPGMAQLITY